MLAELKMELKNDSLDFRQSSNLQGVIMERIDSDYADVLHSSRLNPYSQCLIREGEKKIWYIRTVTQEAYEKILLPLVRLDEFSIKNGMCKVAIANRTLESCSEDALMEEFYQKKCPKYLTINFQTPTAFKRDGAYIIYPDLRLVYGSLMRKYSAASGQWDMSDDTTLEQLISDSVIVRYQLKTAAFPLEKVKITGFYGNICIHIKGSETMARYVRLLLRFGKYSGIGIKTGIGMGAVSLADWSEKNER